MFSSNISQYGIYRNILEASGKYTTSLRTGIVESIKHIQEKKVTAVILDLEKPTINNKDIWKFVSSTMEEGISVVVCVDEIDDEKLQDCMERRDIIVLKKPIDSENLLSSLSLL